MARLLRIHFASIGHADARLAPLTLDLRARDGSGTGTDTVLWLRNGGGKSSILNLFYSVFRPDRREFLGTSAEGRARHIEDYVKADDLAFVVTEWDVDPVAEEVLFARPPSRRRIVGQVLSWRDRQRSSDSSKLRRRFFSFLIDDALRVEDVPIEGLGSEPVRSYDAFREWLDELRHRRPELEAYYDDTARRWAEHLEKIGLDPELFRYQLKMNAREGSADEAFRFRTTDEFVRFYLDIAFDSAEADQVSANLQGFRDKLARLPGLRAEQSFLLDARNHLGSLLEAVQAVVVAERDHQDKCAAAGAVARALLTRAHALQGVATEAEAAAQRASKAAKEALNDATRLGRWANGLDRRALELDVEEAGAVRVLAEKALESAKEQVAVGEAAVARDLRHEVQAKRDAKSEALQVAEAEQEPLRRRVARAGTTLRARLKEAATGAREEAEQQRAAEVTAHQQLEEAQRELAELGGEDGKLQETIANVDEWLAERDRERDRLRNEGLLEIREDLATAVERWSTAERYSRERASEQEILRDEGRRRAQEHEDAVEEHAKAIAKLDQAIATHAPLLESARRERSRLQSLPVLREVEGSDVPDLDVPGVADRLMAEADAVHRSVLIAAVEGADDDRAWQALERTGRLPPAADVENVLSTLKGSEVPAWSGMKYLVENVPEITDRERLVKADPAARQGIVVPDAEALTKAQAYLETFKPRMPVVLTTPNLHAGVPSRDRLVLPGHPAHWDPRAGTTLRDEIGERRARRERERDARLARERAARQAAREVQTWKEKWGEGRLTAAESDQEQRRLVRERREADRLASLERAELAREAVEQAEQARQAADKEANAAKQSARELQGFIERVEAQVEAKRDRRAQAVSRRAELARAQETLLEQRKQHQAAWVVAHDASKAAEKAEEDLTWERDAVELHDEEEPEPTDLVRARAAWQTLSGQWHKLVSENQLKWELDQLEHQLRLALARERKLAHGREAAVAAVPTGAGEDTLETAKPLREGANNAAIEARSEEKRAKKALEDDGERRREADDLPADEPPPSTAEQTRERAKRCRSEREVANERHREEKEAEEQHTKRHATALAEIEGAELQARRVTDILGEVGDGPKATLPEGSAAIDALVNERVSAIRESEQALSAATKAAERHGEALREVALSAKHETHRSRVKERLKAPAPDLAQAAEELHEDVESRLEVVRADLSDIDQDRRLVLQALDKVAMDGVRLLKAADGASRLPSGLGVWEGESFLRIRADVPGSQSERQARLEPMLDRVVEKAVVPAGRELVDLAVRELAGHRIEATLLKPDALLRRDRMPVTEMQTFSRGQQLTVAILLYCTMARLRAQQRGRAHRPDAGVLLLDNPVGTCSSVALLDIQREVARQMRVQLVYTTGVNDANAVATFPNTVRLRNAHRGRSSGDLHVTVDERAVEAIRIVATT